jgi:hypothetical protein
MLVQEGDLRRDGLFVRLEERGVMTARQVNHFMVSAREARHLGDVWVRIVPYRARLDLMQDVAELRSFNDDTCHRFLKKIKDAVDPNGILSPGHYGVWSGASSAGPTGWSPRRADRSSAVVP